jgi:transcriptional regulator with XRE-family HTH domain
MSQQKKSKLDRFDENCSDRLKQVRIGQGLKQAEFAIKIGVPQNTYSNWETKTSKPTLSAIIAAAYRFSISEAWLRYGEGKMLLPVVADPAEVFEREKPAPPVDNFQVCAIHEGLTPDEATLVRHYREMSDYDRKAIMHSAACFSGLHKQLKLSERQNSGLPGSTCNRKKSGGGG